MGQWVNTTSDTLRGLAKGGVNSPIVNIKQFSREELTLQP